MSILSRPYFHDEAAAFEKLESIVWPNGPVCPHCGAVDRISAIIGKSARIGLKFCGHCRKQFTVRVGTVFERSHVPLHKWLQATHLMCSSKKGISAHQLHRVLEVTYKTAWFMEHRLREAMMQNNLPPMGGVGKVVEADETFIGRRKNVPMPKGGIDHKMKVVGLVERGGEVRTFKVDKVNAKTVSKIVNQNVRRTTRLMTDEAHHYKTVGGRFWDHGAVNHRKGEYVNGDKFTNTIEGYFSIFKRGMKGVYQHCGEQHLHRYLAEFDFRYNNRIALGVDDSERTKNALRGIVGKRLTYNPINTTR
jgi:transposase-like protein